MVNDRDYVTSAHTDESAMLRAVVGAERIVKERAAIDEETTNTQEVAALLHSVITQLEEKLSPVSTPSAPRGLEQTPSEPDRGCSPLYYRVRETNFNLRDAIERLSVIRRNLEV